MNPPNPALPDEMRYITVETPGGPDAMRLATGALPALKPQDLLIRVQAAGINRPDIQQRKGAYPPPPGASPILGLEAAGIVAAIGDQVTGWRIGDQVTALCNGGAYAEYAAAPATQCLPWPAGFSATEAAALPETSFTVWANLFDIGRLRHGDSVLVHGGTSGIGVTTIQFATAFGAKVYATAGTPEKCAACEKLGAVAAINYRSSDFAGEIKKLTDGAGVDIVLDMIGAPYTAKNLQVLKRDGRLVQIAFMSGSRAESLDLLPIMLKRLTVTGSTMRPRTAQEKAVIAQSLLEVAWAWMNQGQCKPLIDASFPLANAAEAHRLMESSSHIGKIVLTI
jgi:NADPH2:quinone reductase